MAFFEKVTSQKSPFFFLQPKYPDEICQIVSPPPHLHLKSRLKERHEYEMNLKKVGADLILNTVNDLKDINLNLF